MAGFSDEDLEKEFLEAMATRFCFSGKNRIIFEERFRDKNARCTNTEIATTYYEELVEGTKNGDAVRIFNQQLSAINKKLEKEGCQFPPNLTKSRWKFAKKWLREEIFPQWYRQRQELLWGSLPQSLWEEAKKWLREEIFPQWYRQRQELLSVSLPQSLSQLWELMRSRAKRTDKMGPVLWEGPATLGARPKKPSPYLREVPKDSDIFFKVQLERSGYLIMLEREPNGTVCCLCPSEYAVTWQLPAGEVILPQPGSPDLTFGADEEGWEQWLAIASLESPPFAWLEESKVEAVLLDGDRLLEVWKYVDANPDCQLMYAEYRVTG